MFIKISISENDLPSMRFEYRDSPYVLAYPFKGYILYKYNVFLAGRNVCASCESRPRLPRL